MRRGVHFIFRSLVCILGHSRRTYPVWWSSETLFRAATRSIASPVVEGRTVEPFTNSNIPPLSIAQVDWTLDGEHELAPSTRAAAGLLALQETQLSALITRVGEVEAAEWALDQARAACDVQIAAALAAGVPAEKVVEVAGELVPTLTESSKSGNPRLPTADSPLL